MSRLHFNVSGNPDGDEPVMVADQVPDLRLTGPFSGDPINRWSVTIPPSVTGGATVGYDKGSQRFRVIVPPGGGDWEAGQPPCLPPGQTPESVILNYRTTTLDRLSADGSFLRAGDRPFTWAMMTGFCDYQLWLTGRRDELHGVWQQARDLGANGRRILGMMAFITQFDPRAFGDAYFAEMPAFVAAAADQGLRLHWDIGADNQVFQFTGDFWQRCYQQLAPLSSVVIGAGNEWQKNGFDPFALPAPGVFASQGSSISDTAPPMPGWGLRCWHGRRDDPKVWLSFDDAFFVGRGITESGQVYAPVAPCVGDEMIGFGEVNIPGRRSTDPLLARSLMLSERALGAGGTFHCEDGIFSRPLGPTQQTCARAYFDAQG